MSNDLYFQLHFLKLKCTGNTKSTRYRVPELEREYRKGKYQENPELQKQYIYKKKCEYPKPKKEYEKKKYQENPEPKREHEIYGKSPAKKENMKTTYMREIFNQKENVKKNK